MVKYSMGKIWGLGVLKLNITFYLMLLVFYAALTLIFMVFNMLHTKKYINMISISHVFGLLTVIFMVFSTMTDTKWVLHGIATICFLWSNFSFYTAINNFLNKRFHVFFIYLAIVVSMLDFFAFTFMPSLSLLLHKVVLMSIYIYLGICVLRLKNKLRSFYYLGGVIIGFASIQFYYVILWFFANQRQFFMDTLAFIVQTFAYSILFILVTLDREKRELYDRVSTLQETLQEVYQIDKLKTEFIANISHELRTPINILYSSIQLFEVNLLKDNNIDKCSLSYLKAMKQNCFRLIRLVNNIIDMSKIEAGFLQLNLQNVNIVALIEEITLSIVPYAGQKLIEVQFDIEFEEKVIACDTEKIERILLNLLSNAIKFSISGGRIEVYLCNNEEQVLISVKDNGVGIPYEMQECIFERFTQVKETFIRDNEGSGIGLSLVKSLVEMHGGNIEVQSLPNRKLESTNEEIIISKEINMKKVDIELSDLYV
jgi:signal transduction histidine kinase